MSRGAGSQEELAKLRRPLACPTLLKKRLKIVVSEQESVMQTKTVKWWARQDSNL
jgi:hypothetical protein